MAMAFLPSSEYQKYTESPKNTIWIFTNGDDIPRAIKQHNSFKLSLWNNIPNKTYILVHENFASKLLQMQEIAENSKPKARVF